MTRNDITEKYTKIIENMILKTPKLEIRMLEIMNLNEEYLNEVGTQLPENFLEKLGSWLLVEFYSDKRTNKASIEEYPCLSATQELRRKRKLVNVQDELILEVLNYHKNNNSIFRKKGEEINI